MKFYLLESHTKNNTLTTKAKRRKAKWSNSLICYPKNIASHKLKFLCHGTVHPMK